MSEKETVQAATSQKKGKPTNPAGVLQFHPLGTPPEMRFFALSRGQTEIGRSDGCAIQIEDDQASRKHAVIEKSADGWQITDCESKNGVFVNGLRVTTSALHGGEVVRVGSALFRFLREGTASRDCVHALCTTGLAGGPALEEIRVLLDRAARSDLTILLTGETGTGKEVAAQQIHQAGKRCQAPFVPVNCAAVPEDILESELFGHVKGAFSGAAADSPGLIRRAEGGTLFLDEIGELPLAGQAKLLRVLQDHRIRPVGGTQWIAVDLRVVCATNRDLSLEVQRGSFREDLYARIAELVIHLPPLRQRVEDIPFLVHHFTEKHGGGRASSSVEVLEQLCCRSWPRNVRELESTIRRALLLAEGEPEVRPEHIAADAEERPSPAAEERPAQEPQAKRFPEDDPLVRQLDEVLRRHKGDVDRAAAELGLSVSQVYRRAKKLGIQVPSYRS